MSPIAHALAFLPFGEELSYLVEGRRTLHLFFHFLLYPLVFLSHRHELPLLVLEALLNVVPFLPILDKPLHLGDREDVVLEVVYDLKQLVLRA